ncbi:uncharacterized protein AB675_6169 [Cyphellophora attinorum]|uniref:Galactosyl transferase GMA12/MNN10 family protein n=1 Tax=Cyphellophora attinorum TaxID=1664694 RepID=A0A0N0NQQ1_9EURO|nr:uncharacterized protein AB675_6169 [Phialophora attinorum]KPI43959.1 hypothetical protein AB675_6169 [Phialophora attinorum]
MAAFSCLLLVKSLDRHNNSAWQLGPQRQMQETSKVFSVYNPLDYESVQGPRADYIAPDVAKVSMLYGDNDYYLRAIETHIKHAKRHRYPTYILRKELINGVWNKLLCLMHAMVSELSKGEHAAKWIMWFDADSAVVNPAVPLTVFLPPEEHSDIHFLGSKDQSGFNAGMFFIKVHKWSLELLANAMTYEHHRPDIDLSFLEQTSLYLELNRTENRKHVLYQPRPWFNTYEFHHAYEGEKGDVFVHFPGLEEDRWKHMADWLSILEGPQQKDWEVELHQTKYPARVAEFWEVFGTARKQLEMANERIRGQEPTRQPLREAMDAAERILWSETDQIVAMKEATQRLTKEMSAAGLMVAVEAVT